MARFRAMSYPAASVFSVRFVHTSDWHLGKRLHEASLLEDQAHALDQLYLVLVESRADALVIAGDLYDRAVPPVDAVELMGEFFARVTRSLGIPILAISGNHDSPERLGFGAELLERGLVFVRTQLARRADPITVKGLPFYCLPYVEPDVVRAALGDEGVRTHDQAVRAALAAAQEHRGRRPGVVVAHLFAQGGLESAGSERPLVIGGAAVVEHDALDGWTYVALGHLHAPQEVAGQKVRYSGSLLKYSFDEVDQRKGVTVVEVGRGVRAEHVNLSPRRELARVIGTFDELLEDPRFGAAEAAYVDAVWTDAGYRVDAAARLRRRFPHLLLARPQKLVIEPRQDVALRRGSAARDTRQLLGGFFAHVQEDPPSDEAARLFEQALERARRAEGAASPPPFTPPTPDGGDGGDDDSPAPANGQLELG
jgi:exonuclease SbcD